MGAKSAVTEGLVSYIERAARLELAPRKGGSVESGAARPDFARIVPRFLKSHLSPPPRLTRLLRTSLHSRLQHMSHLQPLAVELAPFASSDFALLPSPTTFFNGHSAYNAQLPPTAAYACSPAPSEHCYHSDSAPSPANSFDFATQSSRSASPATSFAPSPKLDCALLPGLQQQQQQQQPVHDYQSTLIAPISLANASALLSNAQIGSGNAQQPPPSSLTSKVRSFPSPALVGGRGGLGADLMLPLALAAPQYEVYEYQQQLTQSVSSGPQHPSQYMSTTAPMALPAVVYQQQHYSAYQQHPQSASRPQEAYHLPSAQAQSLVTTYHQPQQAQQQQQFAPAPPAPFMATPSFETPQGTFYFVPNAVSQQQASAAIPIASGLPMPMGMVMPAGHSRSQSSTSWDGDVEEVMKVKSVVKKSKKASAKNQTKRFVSGPCVAVLGAQQ